MSTSMAIVRADQFDMERRNLIAWKCATEVNYYTQACKICLSDEITDVKAEVPESIAMVIPKDDAIGFIHDESKSISISA